MNILHTVESYYPTVGGMAEAVRQISEGLVRLGHKVTVATGKMPARKTKIINGVYIEEFAVSGKAVFGMHGEKNKYRNFLINSEFDIVTNFAAQQWATDITLPILGRIKAKKVFVPTGFSGLHLPWYQNYFRCMKKWMKKYDMNIFLSKSYRDIDFARKNHIRNFVVIPNGASEKEFSGKPKVDIRKILDIPKDRFLILNVSSHTGSKGHKETIQIFRQAKIPNSTLLMIGKHTRLTSGCYLRCQLSKLLSGKKILIKDLTRRETVAAFKAADVFLFTSRIECSPIVLFESIAAKTPFLTSDVGNAREIIERTKGGKLLPRDINKSAAILEKYYRHPSELSEMGKAGHTAWKKKFTWEKIAREYEILYQSLIHD